MNINALCSKAKNMYENLYKIVMSECLLSTVICFTSLKYGLFVCCLSGVCVMLPVLVVPFFCNDIKVLAN